MSWAIILPLLKIIAISTQANKSLAWWSHIHIVILFSFCKFTIIGHSETKEKLNTVKQKIDIALDLGIILIVCFKKEEDAEKETAKTEAKDEEKKVEEKPEEA